MAYTRREYYTQDKQMQKYLDELMRTSVARMPPRVAMDFGRHKTIRRIRELDRHNPLISIGNDRKFGVSIVQARDPVKINKKGDRYIFNL